MAYQFLKSLLDPVVVLLAVLAAGYLVARRRGDRRGRAVFLMAFALVYVASTAPLSESLCYLLERHSYASVPDDRRPLDVVVVLAGGVTSNRSLGTAVINRQSTIRLVRAIEVFHSSGARYLVCSGSMPFLNEAGLMAETAGRLGVPAGSIRIDVRSTNTREHPVEVSKMFPDKHVRIGLVTSAYHMPRSTHEFRKYFPGLVAYPTDFMYSYRRFTIFTLVPSAARLDKLSTAVSELVGIAWYRVKDKLSA